jgi:hypothetical protein
MMMTKMKTKVLVLESLLRSIKKNDFVDSVNDLDDVSSFGLGGNDGEEFGNVSTRLITHYVNIFATCFEI